MTPVPMTVTQAASRRPKALREVRHSVRIPDPLPEAENRRFEI